MKHLLSILLIACVCVGSFAQTPYDSFAPETSRPMLELPEPEPSPDTLFCAIVADMSNQPLLLVDVSSREIMATAPITDDLRKWLSVDPLSDKYPNISPYAYAAWNPIKYVDPDGRDIYTFDSDGNFTGNIIKQEGDHIGRIYFSDDNYLDFTFNDQADAQRICTPFSDKYFSFSGKIDDNAITHVSFISDKQISNVLPLKDFKYLGMLDFWAGAGGGKIGALSYACGGIASLLYAGMESRGGKLDFVNDGLIQNDANALFLPRDGMNVGYNSFDFGNYLWGQSMQRLNIPLGISLFGANVDNLLNQRSWQLDSYADQQAIRNGYIFKIIGK